MNHLTCGLIVELLIIDLVMVLAGLVSGKLCAKTIFFSKKHTLYYFLLEIRVNRESTLL